MKSSMPGVSASVMVLLTSTAIAVVAPVPCAFGQGTAPPERPGASNDPAGNETIVEASALEPGANSFTEGQARSRMEDAGFADVQDLRKDDQGFWRGRATRSGATTDVAMDFRGRIAAGPGVAALGTASGADASAPRSSPPRDGAPGNPPSTATGRAADRMQGETPRADGTPGNPPGTAGGRAIDRATGTNPSPAPSGSGGPSR